ncbi:hypothetical protein FD755_025755, partial [Muntiacus reevesi]
CAAQEAPAELDPTQITADWRSILTAADNKEKIEEGGPLRVYMRRLECTENCSSIAIKFYVKFQDACFPLNIVAERKGEVYRTGYMGANFFELIPMSDNALAIYSENFDGVTTTKVTHLLGTLLNLILSKLTFTWEDSDYKSHEAGLRKGCPLEN